LFSSSETHILGELADEPNFKEAFEKGIDLHSFTAWNIWKDKMDIDPNLPMPEITRLVKKQYGDTFRQYAKSIGFSLPYDTTGMGLGRALGVSTKVGDKYIEEYRELNKGIALYMDKNKDFVMENGYIEGSYGERLYLHNAKGYNWRDNKRRKKNWDAIAEFRKATNFIMQSDNAFLLYKGLISFNEEINKLGLDISLIATIYDSIYIRVNKDIEDIVVWNLLKKHFEIKFFDMLMPIDIGIALNKDKTYSNRWGHLTDIRFEDLAEIKKINS